MPTEPLGRREPAADQPQPIIALLGKGGVGKTVLGALLSRVLLERGVRPLLLVDADPVGGLAAAIGESPVRTLGAVRDEVIQSARRGGEGPERLATDLDYLLLAALVERDDYSLLAMGRSAEKGCYCPVNTLLRDAIEALLPPFRAVLIDGEAGVEQVNRQVTRRVGTHVLVADGSRRSTEAVRLLMELLGPDRTFVVLNRCPAGAGGELPPGTRVLGGIPEDRQVLDFDRAGRSLWQLPAACDALVAAGAVATALGFP
jgi:CO dehydrogenase maturation factor